MRIVAAICATFLVVGCTTDSADRDTSSDATSEASETAGAESGEPDPMKVPCRDGIGIGSSPTGQAPYTVLASAVALPSTTRPALQASPIAGSDAPDALPSGDWLFAKRGLVIRGGNRIHLRVAPESSDDIRIGWGNGSRSPSASVLAGCSPNAGWLAFPGGYWVRNRGCYAIQVSVNDRPTRKVNVGVGAPCAGQRPPVDS